MFIMILAVIAAIGFASVQLPTALATSAAIISDISKDQVVSVGDDVEFSCTVKNVENFAVGWSKYTGESRSGSVVLSIRSTLSLGDPRYFITETKDKESATYTFKITKIEASDMGTYECQVIVSAVDKVTKNVRLSVKHPPIISEERTPKTMTVTEGHNLEVSCYADGFPQPTISWKREDNSIMPAGGHSLAGNTLRLKQAHRLDRGGYYCVADNGVGKPDQRIVRVEVEFRPQIGVSRPKVAQVPTHPAELECNVQGYPPPAVSWHKNGAQLQSGSLYEITNMASSHETTNSVLRILSIKEGDFGDYYCNATNKLGHADARLHLFQPVIAVPSNF